MKKKGSKKIIIVILVLIVIVLAAVAALMPKKEAVVEDTRPAVSAQTPELRDIAVYTEQIGSIEPAESVSVIPMMSGEVLTINFNVGDHVTEGDVLCTLNSDALTSLKIQVDSAKINMDDANTALARTQALAATGAVATSSLEQAQSAASGAKLAYESAKNQYDLQVKYTNITAPISGVIESKNIEVHDMVSPSMPVCVVSAKDGINISFGASEDVMKNLKVGDTLTAEKDNKEYKGTVTEVGTMVSASGLYQVKANLDHADELTTGSKAKVTLIKKQEKQILSIPLSAVYYSGNDPFVYVLKDNKAVKTAFTSGTYDDTYIAVEDGLTPEDEVIYTWNNELYDGAEVVKVDETTEAGNQ